MNVQEVCTNAGVLSVISIVLGVLKFIFIAAPILAIVMISIDFFKNVVDGKEDAVKKNLGIAIKRMLWCVAVFLVPFITSTLVSLLGNLGVNYAMCIENSKHFTDFIVEDKDEITPGSSSSSSGSSSSTGTSTTNKNDVAFKLGKERVVVGHYKNTVNKYTIVIKDSKGKKLTNTNYTFKSSNPAIASVTKKGVIKGKFGGTTTITVTSKANASNKKKMKVLVVHTLYTRVKVTQKVTGVSAKTGKKVTLKKGTTGIYNGIGPNSSYNGYLPGDTIKVDGDYISIDSSYVTPEQYYVSSIYAKEDVESFVNQYNFESNTKYLFWSNSGTGMEYMFTGKKGKWKLYKQFYINVGDAALLLYKESARTGVHFNYYVGYTSHEPGYTYKVIWKQASPTHRTNPWHEYGTGNRYPASHGCTRFQTQDIKYLLSIHSKIQYSKLIDF